MKREGKIINENKARFIIFFINNGNTYFLCVQTMAKGKHAPAPGAIRKDKVIHPNSRKANKIKAKVQRTSRLQGKSTVGGSRLQALGEKLSWFKESLEICLDDERRATPATLLSLAEAYLDRFKEEIEQIALKASIGPKRRRQHASRLDVVEHTSKLEEEEFSGCGLEMPDLLDADNFEYFLSWEGELKFVQNIKLRRFTRSWLEAEVGKEEGEAIFEESREVDKVPSKHAEVVGETAESPMQVT